MRRHLIVGSGISGMIGALKFKEKNKDDDVIIVERDSMIGGLYKSYDYGEGRIFDHGMHNFCETDIDELNDFLHEILKDKWNVLSGQNRDLAGLYFNNSFQMNSVYPDLRNFDRQTKNTILGELFTQFSKPSLCSSKSAFDYSQNQFGETVTELVVRPTLEKVFTKKIEKLHKVAAKILPLDRIILFDQSIMNEFQKSDLFRQRLGCTEQKQLPLSLSSGRSSLYPKEFGTWRIVESLEKMLISAGVRILTNTTVEKLNFCKNKIKDCVLKDNNSQNEISIDISGNVLWTVGIPKISAVLGQKYPEGKPDKLNKTVLANFIVNKPPVFGDLHYIFCYKPEFLSMRINNYFNYCPLAKSEFGYPINSELIVDSDDIEPNAILKRAEDELKYMGILKDHNIVFKKMEVVPEAFPMPTINNIGLIDQIRKNAENLELKNLIMVGIMSSENLFFQRHVLPDMYRKVTEAE